jgi:LPXTG-site transpeptidase (sortase) family protein
VTQLKLEPISDDMKARAEAGRAATVAMMRAKVAKALGQEPEATDEIAGAIIDKTPSKHQLFMRDLAASGKSLAEVQTEWHRYYTLLPDKEKREVWQEFYDSNQNTKYEELFRKAQTASPQQPAVVLPQVMPAAQQTLTPAQPRYQPLPAKSKKPSFNPKSKAGRKAQKIANEIHKKVSANGQLKLKHHLQSLAFGFGMGALVLLFVLFGFFNEYFIAPFIQPSRSVSNTPIIVSEAAAESATPTVIVPKINVQVPIDFNVGSVDEGTIQASLKGGVVHYPSTVKPGENGNGAYFGHSSQNLLNSGKFKYAFILLHELTTGDVFYITYQGKVYAYQVFAREVVKPTQVSVINDTKGKQATATLITCDPPGISSNRLVVWGEQISPGIATNTTPATTDSSLVPAEITGKGDSAWSRFVRVLQFWKSDTSSSE